MRVCRRGPDGQPHEPLDLGSNGYGDTQGVPVQSEGVGRSKRSRSERGEEKEERRAEAGAEGLLHRRPCYKGFGRHPKGTARLQWALMGWRGGEVEEEEVWQSGSNGVGPHGHPLGNPRARHLCSKPPRPWAPRSHRGSLGSSDRAPAVPATPPRRPSGSAPSALPARAGSPHAGPGAPRTAQPKEAISKSSRPKAPRSHRASLQASQKAPGGPAPTP